MVYSIIGKFNGKKVRVPLVVVILFMEADYLCSMFFVPCTHRFGLHNNFWPVNCHFDLKKKLGRKTVKLTKRYNFISTKRYHFGSFMHKGVCHKSSKTVTVSEKRLGPSGFFSEMVSFRTI